MSVANGLGVVKDALLASFDAVGSHGAGPRRRCDHVLRVAEADHGVLPGVGFAVLRSLVSRSSVMVPLFDGAGNFGERGTPASEPSFVQARLTAVGDAALAATRGTMGAVPVGLVNGTMWAGGERPSLDPLRLCAALRASASRAPDAAVVDLIGSPRFATGCRVAGDVSALAAGVTVSLRLSPRVVPLDDRRVRVSSFAPDTTYEEAGRAMFEELVLAWQRRGRRVVVRVPATARPSWEPMFDIEHGSTVDRAELVGMIERLTTVTVRAGYGAPIAEVVRDWIGAHGAEDLDRRLSALEDAGRAR